jgi:site-specific recombinase XerD
MKNKLKDCTFFWNMTADFLNHYLPDVRRTSNNTVETYRNCLNRYIDYLEQEKNIRRKEICFNIFDREHLKEYMTWMNKAITLSPKTCNLRLTAIHSLLEYVAAEYTDLMAVYMESCTIKSIKLLQKPIEFFEMEAMSALLRTPDIHKKSERRNLMLLIFLYDTAARVSEALDVRVCDLHMEANIPYVTLLGKGRKYRNIPLMKKTQEHLKHYLDEFHGQNNTMESPLFYAVTHGIKHKLSTDTPEKMIKKYAKEAAHSYVAMPEYVHCHMIRKTRAMNLYQEGIPLTHIQQLLGHENLSTTSGFYAFATLETIAKSLEKANPSVTDKAWKKQETLEKLYKL